MSNIVLYHKEDNIPALYKGWSDKIQNVIIITDIKSCNKYVVFPEDNYACHSLESFDENELIIF